MIVKGFGKQKHDIFTGVETNNGIDIATEKIQRLELFLTVLLVEYLIKEKENLF